MRRIALAGRYRAYLVRWIARWARVALLVSVPLVIARWSFGFARPFDVGGFVFVGCVVAGTLGLGLLSECFPREIVVTARHIAIDRVGGPRQTFPLDPSARLSATPAAPGHVRIEACLGGRPVAFGTTERIAAQIEKLRSRAARDDTHWTRSAPAEDPARAAPGGAGLSPSEDREA
ncbi:MAG TPA: hypothetical protein VEA69_12930 [Tepidisphaeraceae bacterium]|nr:hypothetical protein [Tepidisphaeraceae bacterium]